MLDEDFLWELLIVKLFKCIKMKKRLSDFLEFRLDNRSLKEIKGAAMDMPFASVTITCGDYTITCSSKEEAGGCTGTDYEYCQCDGEEKKACEIVTL